MTSRRAKGRRRHGRAAPAPQPAPRRRLLWLGVQREVRACSAPPPPEIISSDPADGDAAAGRKDLNE